MRTLSFLAALATLLLAAPARAHQDTIAHSRMSIRANGDVEYALKIPVEDLAESLGRDGHTALDAPQVRAAEELLFRHFQPLLGMTSGGVPCPVERSGIDVPEDERLYGELRFVFHCPAGAPVTLDYRVFFDIDPGHMGMLDVETPGGTTRAEIIRERRRWEVRTTADGPPEIRAVEDSAAGSTTATSELIASGTLTSRTWPDARRASDVVEALPAKTRRSYSDGMLIALVALVAVAGAAAFHAMRVAQRRRSSARR
jgi:hypothetical protein